MAFLSTKELGKLGFKLLGKNVKISDKVSLYRPERMSIGDNSRVDDFCLLAGKLTIGKNVHIAPYCNVAGGEVGITIDDFSGLAYGCHVFSQSDDYTGVGMTNPTIPEKYRNVFTKEIYIKRHVIVGSCSIVLPGIILEEGTSVGAMSLVTKNTKPWSVYFGIPARYLKKRKRDLLMLEQQYLDDINRI